MSNPTTTVNYEGTTLLPETVAMLDEMGVGFTRDKWELDSFPVGGFRLVKASDMPSKGWTGPSVSDTQKAAGMKISVRKTLVAETPLMVIRLA